MLTEDIKQKAKKIASEIDEKTNAKVSNMMRKFTKEMMREKPQRECLTENDLKEMIRVFLDTNALSNVLNGTTTLGKDVRTMAKHSYRFIHCFSIYTLYEIYNGDKERWKKLLNFLSEIYFIVFLTKDKIVKYEYNKYIGKETSEREILFYFGIDIKDTKGIKEFEKMICDFCAKEIKEIELERKVVEIIKQNYKKAKLNEQRMVEAVLSSLGLKLLKKEDYIYFPSIRVFALSVFGRASNTNRKNIGNNDIIDTWISYCMPYIHEIITEREQSGILEQAKNKISEIKHLKITKINEFAENKKAVK